MDFFENEELAAACLPDWAHDSERVIQCTWYELDGEWREMGLIEDMRGTDAGVELFEFVTAGREAVLDEDGKLLGFVEDDRKYLYFDCDEMPYSEMYPDSE